jgi:hypothetical protein
MKCRQFEQRLHHLLDHRQMLLSDRRLTAHAAQCRSCDRMLHSYLLLEQHFADMTAAPIVASAACQKPKPASVETGSWSDRRRWRAALAIAASIMALIISLLATDSMRDSRQVAQHEVDYNQSPNSGPAIHSLPANMGLEDLLATIEQLPEQLEQLGPVYQYTAHVTGVAPLTSSLNVTVDLLRQQIGNPPAPKKRLHRTQGTWLSSPSIERAV